MVILAHLLAVFPRDLYAAEWLVGSCHCKSSDFREAYYKQQQPLYLRAPAVMVAELQAFVSRTAWQEIITWRCPSPSQLDAPVVSD